MKTEVFFEVRRFPVSTKDVQTGEIFDDHIILTKNQLQAAQIVGESSKELIQRIYKRQGFSVLYIGKPERKSIAVNLDALWVVGV